ncbi:MAG: methionyl-tRNA formyltransferase [Phycisphaerales bacterium]
MDRATTDVVFFGSGAFGAPTLERLARTRNVSAIVTQPDRPAGRGSKLTPTPIAAWASEHVPGTPILKPERIAESDVIEQVRAAGADAWVIIAYGQKLPRALLADRFAINLHASLLPRWRGAAPINWAILAGDAESGNSVITIADRMDAGEVLAQSRRLIEPSTTAGELHDVLAADGPDLVEEVLDRHARGDVQATTQDESLVTHARKLAASDAWVDFREPASRCRCRINGLSPWPGVLVHVGDDALKLLRAQEGPALSETEGGGEGRIVDAPGGLVVCADGTTLRLLEVQPAGKRRMSWSDFARGRGGLDAARLESRRIPTC